VEKARLLLSHMPHRPCVYQRAFQDYPKSYVEWAITQIPPVSAMLNPSDMCEVNSN
jgi:hypothetical protein